MAATWTFATADNKLIIKDGLGQVYSVSSGGSVKLHDSTLFDMSFAGQRIRFSFADINDINGGGNGGDALGALGLLNTALPTGGDTGIFA